MKKEVGVGRGGGEKGERSTGIGRAPGEVHEIRGQAVSKVPQESVILETGRILKCIQDRGNASQISIYT